MIAAKSWATTVRRCRRAYRALRRDAREYRTETTTAAATNAHGVTDPRSVGERMR